MSSGERARPPGQKTRLRDYFRAHVGEVVDSETLRTIAGKNSTNWSRRVRELRDEGLNIQTHNDRDDLQPGQYVLKDLIQLEPKSKPVSKETRALVLERDGYTCQMCGAGAGEIHSHNARRTVLQVAHIVDRSHGGTDDISNLRTACSVCNEGASNISPNRPDSDKIKAQLRRAAREDQVRILTWLIEKFADVARETIRTIDEEEN